MGFFSSSKYYVGNWLTFRLNGQAENPTKGIILYCIAASTNSSFTEVFNKYVLQSKYYSDFRRYLEKTRQNTYYKTGAGFELVNGNDKTTSEDVKYLRNVHKNYYVNNYTQSTNLVHSEDGNGTDVWEPLESNEEYLAIRKEYFATKYPDEPLYSDLVYVYGPETPVRPINAYGNLRYVPVVAQELGTGDEVHNVYSYFTDMVSAIGGGAYYYKSYAHSWAAFNYLVSNVLHRLHVAGEIVAAKSDYSDFVEDFGYFVGSRNNNLNWYFKNKQPFTSGLFLEYGHDHQQIIENPPVTSVFDRPLFRHPILSSPRKAGKWISPKVLRVFFYKRIPSGTYAQYTTPWFHYDIDVTTIYPDWPIADEHRNPNTNPNHLDHFYSKFRDYVTYDEIYYRKYFNEKLYISKTEGSSSTPDTVDIRPYYAYFEHPVRFYEGSEGYKVLIDRNRRLTSFRSILPIDLKHRWRFLGDIDKNKPPLYQDILDDEIRPLLKYAGFKYEDLVKDIKESGYNNICRDAYFHYAIDYSQKSEHAIKYFIFWMKEKPQYYEYNMANTSRYLQRQHEEGYVVLDDNAWYENDSYEFASARSSTEGIHKCGYKKGNIDRYKRKVLRKGEYKLTIKWTPERRITHVVSYFRDGRFHRETRTKQLKSRFIEIIHQETEEYVVYYRIFSPYVVWEFPDATLPTGRDQPPSTLSLDSPGNDQLIFIPLRIGILQDFPNYAGHALLNDSARISMYMLDKKKLAWYKDPDKLMAVTIVLTIVTAAFSAAASIAAASAATASASVIDLITTFVINVAIDIAVNYAITELVRLIDPELALIILAALVAVSAYGAIANATSLPGLPFADEAVLTVGNNKITGGKLLASTTKNFQSAFRSNIQDINEDLLGEIEEFETEYEDRLSLIEEGEESLSGYGLEDKLPYLQTIMSGEQESPNAFYNRTLNFNPGEKVLNSINTYANLSLNLPLNNSNFITTQFAQHQLSLYKV